MAIFSLEQAVTSLTQVKLQASPSLQRRSYKFLDLKQFQHHRFRFPEAFELSERKSETYTNSSDTPVPAIADTAYL